MLGAVGVSVGWLVVGGRVDGGRDLSALLFVSSYVEAEVRPPLEILSPWKLDEVQGEAMVPPSVLLKGQNRTKPHRFCPFA